MRNTEPFRSLRNGRLCKGKCKKRVPFVGIFPSLSGIGRNVPRPPSLNDQARSRMRCTVRLYMPTSPPIWRNQRPQEGGDVSPPARPRVTWKTCYASVETTTRRASSPCGMAASRLPWLQYHLIAFCCSGPPPASKVPTCVKVIGIPVDLMSRSPPLRRENPYRFATLLRSV